MADLEPDSAPENTTPSKHSEKTERSARVGEVTSPIGSPYISPSEVVSPAKRFSLSGEVIFSLSVPSPRGGISPASVRRGDGEVIFSLSVPSPDRGRRVTSVGEGTERERKLRL